MSDTFLVWGQFALVAALIALAGYHLSICGDAIADKTGLGRNWVGTILLATVTSLPELITGISAVTFTNAPDLAIGDVLGSCVFNLAMVVILDFFHREGTSVYTKAGQAHLLSGALGMILLGFVGFGLVLAGRGLTPSFGHVGASALVIPVFYLLAMRTLFHFEQSHPASPRKQEPQYAEWSLERWIGRYIVAALVVVAAGFFLPFLAKRIIVLMGWNEAFVGTSFVALVTSLPELAVSLSALKIGAVDMAFSNLLGSNLFNVVILTADDIFYRKGALFQAASPVHIITAFSSIMMTGLVLVALIHNPKRKVFNTISVMSLLLLGVYILNSVVIYRLGG